MSEIQSIIDSLNSYPNNFKWASSLFEEPVDREELIDGLKNGSEIGQHFLNEIRRRTIQRMLKEANKPRV